MARKASSITIDSSAHLGFEATAWRESAFWSCEATMRSPQGNRSLTANNLRSNMDAAEPTQVRRTDRYLRHVHQTSPREWKSEGIARKGDITPLLHSSFLLPTFPVLANGSMSSNQSGDCPARSVTFKPKAKPQSLPRQRDIRQKLIEADLVDTAQRDSALSQSEGISQVVSAAKNNMVALPGHLFYSTQILVCLWFLTKNKHDGKCCDRRKHTLFIAARKLGTLIGAGRKQLSLS